MFNKVLSNLKKPKVIVAVASSILLILVNTEVIDVHVSNEIMKIVNLFAGLL